MIGILKYNILIMDTGLIRKFEHIKDDPQELLLLISKYVKIELIKNTMLLGFIYSIDPISKSAILLVPQENTNLFQTVLIPGHAITDITQVHPEPSMKFPAISSAIPNSHSNKEKKKRLMEWFKTNLLSVTESEENILFGNVTILPPYNTTDICTDNPIVAMQVKKVMENMPEDFNPQSVNRIETDNTDMT